MKCLVAYQFSLSADKSSLCGQCGSETQLIIPFFSLVLPCPLPGLPSLSTQNTRLLPQNSSSPPSSTFPQPQALPSARSDQRFLFPLNLLTLLQPQTLRKKPIKRAATQQSNGPSEDSKKIKGSCQVSSRKTRAHHYQRNQVGLLLQEAQQGPVNGDLLRANSPQKRATDVC